MIDSAVPREPVLRGQSVVRWAPVDEPRLRLVCLPFAGGSAAMYRPWTRWLPPDVELLSIELPGRATRRRETPCGDLVAVLDDVAEDLLPWLDRPYVVFGHSLGGLLGYELVDLLATRAHPLPLALWPSASRPPHARSSRRLHLLDDDALLVEVERMGGTPPQLLASAELMAMALPVLRADLELWEARERPAVRTVPVPIVAIGATHDRLASPAHLESWRECSDDVTIVSVDGGHFFLSEQPETMAEVVGERLRSLLGVVS